MVPQEIFDRSYLFVSDFYIYIYIYINIYIDAFSWGSGHGTLRWTRASEQAGKALRSQGHQCAHVM